MCRWAAYIGEPVHLSEVISHPEHSLIDQSLHATQSVTPTNADGVGLAWYGARPTPGVFRDILPAWSDRNLKSVAEHVSSGLFLGHIRASSGAPTSRENCHPFTADNWSFVHNGEVGGFSDFRRHANALIPDDLYHHREGTTDSEAMFLIALHEGLADDPKTALERAAGQLEAMSRAHGSAPHLHM
ncbi:glutamine amidotransferase, partial [Ruegeria sp. ANG-R]